MVSGTDGFLDTHRVDWRTNRPMSTAPATATAFPSLPTTISAAEADYLRRPCVFFLTRNASELAKIVLQEASHAVSGALPPAMRLFGDAVLAIAITALLIAIDPLLALGVASPAALSYGAVFHFARTWLRRIVEERVDGAGTPCGSRQHGP